MHRKVASYLDPREAEWLTTLVGSPAEVHEYYHTANHTVAQAIADENASVLCWALAGALRLTVNLRRDVAAAQRELREAEQVTADLAKRLQEAGELHNDDIRRRSSPRAWNVWAKSALSDLLRAGFGHR